MIFRGLDQIPVGIFGSTRQRSEVKVKLHSNDHEMSGWPEDSDVCVCVHTHFLIHFYVHFSLFILMYVTSIF